MLQRKITKKSVIIGKGFGHTHLWKKAHQGLRECRWDRYTLYECLHCEERFKHYYHVTPDIFKAIERAGIPNGCIT